MALWMALLTVHFLISGTSTSWYQEHPLSQTVHFKSFWPSSLTPMNCPIWPTTLGSVYGRTPYIMHRKYFNISDQLNNAFKIIFIILTGTIKMMNVWNLSSGHYRIWYLVNSSVLKKWIIFISKRQWGAHDSHTSRNGNRKRTRLDQLELCRSADTPFA